MPQARTKGLYHANPVFDFALTAVFLFLAVFVVVTLAREEWTEDKLPPLGLFVVLMAAVAGLVALVRMAAVHTATFLNWWLVRVGLVDKAPIVGTVQLKKWQDQLWQLVVHVAMTVFEVHVLSTEMSGVWGDMARAWHPNPEGWKKTPLVRLLYLTQLVGVGCCSFACPG